MKTKFFWANLLLAILSLNVNAQSDNNVKIKFNGFGDIMAGIPFGNLANEKSGSLFKKYGDDEYPFGMHRGLFVHGVDLLNTVYLNDAIKIQTEVALEGERNQSGGNMQVEIDRCFIDYNLSDGFGIQAGLIYTPIGYVNRNLYSRTWLMNSAYIYQAVEAASGLVQSHFVGMAAYGNLVQKEGKRLSYMLGLGMPRPKAPTAQIFDSQDMGFQLTALLEAHIIKDASDIKIGLSGYTDQIHTFYVKNYGDIVNIEDPASASPLMLQEIGFNPYIVLKGKVIDFLAEYHYVVTDVVKGNYPGTSTMNCLTSEIAINSKLAGKRLAPYIRYDFITLPDDSGPYYGLRFVGENMLAKDYSPNFNALMVGVAYDVASFNRIKLEFIHHFDGPYQENGIYLQTSFGF